MESENFIFLSLFFSLVLGLWGLGGAGVSTPATVLTSSSLGGLDEGTQTSRPEFVAFNKGYFQSNLSFFFSAVLVFFANFVLSTFLLRRWIDSGYPPFSNLYESLLFLTWSLLFLYFPAVDFTTFLKVLFNKQSSLSVKTTQSNSIELGLLGPSFPENPTGKTTDVSASAKMSSFIGMLLVSSSLFIYTFATWVLPSSMKEIKPLVPALKSNWLLMHVSIMLLSYSALLAGSLFSMLYLAIFYLNNRKKEKKNTSGTTTVLDNLDSLSYRSLGFAFPLLTLGIISGSVWANEAWGSYWSWDPKETWALITWFIYSIYLHLRIQKSWAGEKSAWVGALGFFVVWVCYLGVNLLGKGLHSYGWWN